MERLESDVCVCVERERRVRERESEWPLPPETLRVWCMVHGGMVRRTQLMNVYEDVTTKGTRSDS